MISSLKEGILGFQGVIAAGGVLPVKKFSQLPQGRDTEVGPIVILQSCTEFLVNHPTWQSAVRSVG
jgi:hypothetical protein